MERNFEGDVYATLLGQLEKGFEVPGIENLFAPGKPCMQRYSDMLDAYERLRKRLGVAEEDEDVEIIINALLDNQEALCLAMFRYGLLFGQYRHKDSPFAK